MEKKLSFFITSLKSVLLSNLWKMLMRRGILLLFITIQVIGISANAMAQQVVVTGTVTESQTRDVMPGVNIQIKGTSTGIITDVNGKYSITVSEKDAILVFSFIGYSSIDVPIAGRSVIDVVLESALTALDEIVVTGYGTQRKVDVIGSISTVKTEDILTLSTPTVVQSIMGRTSGVFVKTISAQPGDYSGMRYNIRGFGTALIVIDGLPATNEAFLLLDPNDIDQLSILKDAATAASYGARAGNGVILVTTKRGKEQDAQYTVNANYGLQSFTMRPHAVNSEQNARFENVSRANAGMPMLWSQKDIDGYADVVAGNIPEYFTGKLPEYFNTDWWSETLSDYAPTFQTNLNVRGGSEKIKYFVSGGYFSQESLFRSGDLKNDKFTVRTNLDIALTKKLQLGIDLSILQNNLMGPSWDMASTAGHLGIMTLLFRSRPQFPAFYPDRTKYSAMGNDDLNPISATKIDEMGYYGWNTFTSDNKFSLAYKLPYGFDVKALFNYRVANKRDKRWEKLAQAWWYDYDANGNIVYHNHRNFNTYNWLREGYAGSSVLNQQYQLNWHKQYGDHKLDALLVYENFNGKENSIQADRIRYVYDTEYLFAGPDKDKSNYGTASQDGRVSQVFSVDYNLKDKYLFSFNARRDGSPRFPPETRWGFFPSFSAGWRISQENFLKSNSVINNLKLRASWGKLGYDATGAYQYLSTYSIRPAELIADAVVLSGLRADNIPNYNITWEKITTSNVGVDFGLFNDKITGSFDIFYRNRSDVLGARSVSLPDVVGASMPNENINEYSNRGLELELYYRESIGDINFEIGGNVSYSRERVEYVDQPPYASQEEFRRNNKIGRWSDLQWGYLADGVFTSREEIDTWANIDGKNNASVNPGDIKLIDYNGDGILNSYDYVVIGRGASPDIMFAINGMISWKGIDFSMLWQGATGYDANYGSGDLRVPFNGGNAPILEMYKYSYTPENDWGIPANLDPHPVFPRYYDYSYRTHNTSGTLNSFWLMNGTYIRLKTVDLGYNLPRNLIDRFGIKNLKLYVSGYNILTFSALDFFDPEMENTGVYAPTKTYTFGLTLGF